MPLLYDCTAVLASGDRPPTGEMVSQIMKQMKLRALYCPPTVFEELILEPEGLSQISELDFIIFTGGPLAPHAGDQLAKITTVCQLFGSTETGAIPSLVAKGENWPYFEWHPIYELDMQEIYPDTFEMVIPRNPKLTWIRTIQHTFPELEEWRTKDLFRRHPENPALWTFVGRSDDVVVLSNGEMFNPVEMEGIIKGHPLISEALIVGHGRFQAALLVEPDNAAVVDDSFISNIWPVVEKANAEGPGHARIFRSKIIVARPQKPFRRTAKNTIIRRMTTEDYADEIEGAYSGGTKAPKVSGLPKLVLPLETLQQFVQASVLQHLPQYEKAAATSDFYVLGLDSLQTIELASGLKIALTPYINEPELSSVDAKTVYAHASVAALSKHLHGLMTSEPEKTVEEADADRIERMNAVVERYTRDIPERSSTTSNIRRSERLAVVLTGSTGTLGTNILRTLLADPTVAKIYCLNRSPDALQRHSSSGIPLDLSVPRVEFLQASFGDPQFGLSSSKFSELKNSVNVIIHNAWKVDFNHSLESFEEVHIRGVRHFIDWALTSSQNPHILFVSSIGSVANWNAVYPGQTVPEKPLTDYRVAMKQGYSESKHVAVFNETATTEKSGVMTCPLRVGQVSGPMEAGGTVWNRQEWLPALVQTSKALGAIPGDMGDVDWIPVDALARIVGDIAHTNATGMQIFNLVNPRTAKWDRLVQAVRKKYPGIRAVPLADWVGMLKKVDASNKDEVAKKPGIILLEFYESLVQGTNKNGELLRYETKNGESVSKTMRGLGPVRGEWMELWLDQWNF